MAPFLAVLALTSAAAARSAAPVAPPAAVETCAPIDAAVVAGFFDQWNLALASLDPDVVTARYWPDAVLLATASNVPRTTTPSIREYFSRFLQQHPRGRVDARSVQIGCNLAIDAGTYTFSLMNDAGAVTEFPARYTYVYQYRNGAWKILHHHSSLMSEVVTTPLETVPEKAVTVAVAAPAATPGAATAARKGKAKGKGNAKVDARTDAAPAHADGGRTSASEMFLNKNGSPDVSAFYPAAAQARGDRGIVSLRICSDPRGAIAGAPEVVKTSGSADLDAAAQDWARAARWVPATENGSAVEGCTRVSVRFGS